MNLRRGDVYMAVLPDGVRPGPVVVVTRNTILAVHHWVTVASIVSQGRGFPFEVAVGAENGLDHNSFVNTTYLHTIEQDAFGPRLGELSLSQADALDNALRVALHL